MEKGNGEIDSVITLDNGRRKTVRTATGFGRERRARFLDTLALTCNVLRSAEAAGVHVRNCYRARAQDAAFAAQWHAALETGFDRLEALVLEHGGAGVPLAADPDRAAGDGGTGEGGTSDGERFDVERALRILTYARAARRTAERREAPAARHATREETNAALMKALAAAERRVAARAGNETSA